MFYSQIKNKKKLKKQKNRSVPKLKIRFSFKKYLTYLIFLRGGTIELKFYKYILKFFRRRARRLRHKLHFFFLPNNVFTRKPRQARMGHGKGKFRRILVRLASCSVVLAAFGVSKLRFFFLKKYLYHRMSLQFAIV